MTVVSYGEATATDASGIKAILNNAPDYFLPGITTITWIAFDNIGYDSNTTQTVTVKTCGHDTSFYNVIRGTEGDDVIQGTDLPILFLACLEMMSFLVEVAMIVSLEDPEMIL